MTIEEKIANLHLGVEFYYAKFTGIYEGGKVKLSPEGILELITMLNEEGYGLRLKGGEQETAKVVDWVNAHIGLWNHAWEWKAKLKDWGIKE